MPGWDPASCAGAIALVERFPWLDAAVGVHPHDAAKVDRAGWDAIAALAADERVVAIGETGLDFDRLFSPLEAQRSNLRRNLELAVKLGKPAILHCRSALGRRDAQDALLDELRSAGLGSAGALERFAGRPPAVIHSYSGPLDYAEAVLQLGLVVSFSGLVFRPGEEVSAEVARRVPPDRLLVETDSPFLPPPGAPKRRNEPEWVAVTARWLAEQRGEPIGLVGERLVETYDRTMVRSRARAA